MKPSATALDTPPPLQHCHYPNWVADALFPRTKQRVLALLFGQPERQFATSELIRLAVAGSGAVQREIERPVGDPGRARRGTTRPCVGTRSGGNLVRQWVSIA